MMRLHSRSSVLLCDLDGTLVDTVADLASALNRLLHEQSLPALPESTVRRLVGHGAARLVECGLASAGGAPDARALSGHVARFLDIYESAPAARSRPYPGVADTLAELAAGGWRLGVCTNKPQTPSEAILAELGLSRFFDAVGGGDRFPVRKPNGAHLHATLDIMDARGAPAVLVGDSRTDLDAARDAGVPVVLVDYGYAQEPPAALGADALISDFAALPGVLASLVPER